MNAQAIAPARRRPPDLERRRAKRGRQSQRLDLGQYIVADPRICHGKPTFRGTRIMVWQVLSDVAKGKDWDFITQRQWGGRITKEAIGEAVRLAGRALLDEDGRLIVASHGGRALRPVV